MKTHANGPPFRTFTALPANKMFCRAVLAQCDGGLGDPGGFALAGELFAA